MKNKPKYLFKCENGKVYAVCKDMCVVCKHCTDLFYDFTNGPYMFFCDLKDECDGYGCEKFELDLEDKKIYLYKGE